MIDPREEFKEIVRELAQEETKNILQNEDIFRNIMGTIVGVKENNKYDIDIITTTLTNIINQSGVRLKIGDSVIIAEKCGSNYSNCYISAKAGTSANTLDDALDQLGQISFAYDSTNNRLKVTLANGSIKYINFDA